VFFSFKPAFLRKKVLKIYLVRHGATIWNAEHRIQGHTDVPLNETGLEQSRRIAQRLKDQKIDAVWSSDLTRARVTAEILAEPHGLTVNTTPLLRERRFGDWEGLTQEEIVARGDRQLLDAYRAAVVADLPPNAESMQSVWNRLSQALKEIIHLHAEGQVAVVGHGGSLRVILCQAMRAPMECVRHIWLDNACLSLVEFNGDRSWVRLMNDTSHLS
jgi:broad specificity phosphatase PhoE